MYRLRIGIFTLILWLASIIGIASFIAIERYWDVVIAVALSAALIVLFGRISRSRKTVPAIFITYSLILIVSQFTGLSDWFYLTPVVAVVKLLAVTLTAIQAQRLVYQLVDFEDSVTRLSLDLAGLSPRIFEEDLEEVYREVRRARRFDQDLTIAIVKPDYAKADVPVNHIVSDMLERLQQRYLQVKLLELWSAKLNDSDIVVQNEDELILAFPSVSAEKVKTLLEDCEQHAKEWGLPLNYGLSSMPHEAHTYAKLIYHAQQNLEAEISAKEREESELQPALVS